MGLSPDIVVRRPWWFIFLFIGITIAFATQLPRLVIDPEVKSQLPEDMPGRLATAAVEARFGGSEMVMVVVEHDDLLDAAVLRQVKGIAEAMAELPSIDRVLDPFSLTDIQGDGGMMLVEPAIDEIPDSADERAVLRERLAANDLVYGNVISRDFDAASVIGLLNRGAEDEATIASVEQILAAHADGPATLSLGGMPEVRTRVSQDIRGDMRAFVPIGLAVILGFLWICFRQIRGMILPFSVVVMSTIVAMGLIPIFGWKVQMVTVVLPVILLAVANDYGIHLMAKYQEDNQPGSGLDAEGLARSGLVNLGPPVIAAGVTTIAGLLCLTTHIIVPAAQMGILAAIGVLFALAGSLCFIPAVLAVLPVAKPIEGLGSDRGGLLEAGLAWTARRVSAHPLAVAVGVLVVAVAISTGIPHIQVDTNPINYYPSDAPVAQTAALINDNFGGATEVAVMVTGDVKDPELLAGVDALEGMLLARDEVGYTTSIARVVKKMNQVVMGGSPDEYRLPDSSAAVAQYFLLYSMGGDPEDFERIVDFDYEHTVVTARIRRAGTADIARVVEATKAHLADHPLGEETLVAGFGPMFVDLVEAVVRGQLVSLSLSFVLVFILVSILFRSPVAGIYALVPLSLAMPLLFGGMGYLGIELNVVTAMLSSIMVGVGVDYTIHFLWRYRDERRAGKEPADAVFCTLSTSGRGIVFNALSVVVGFAVVMISNFLPVQFFGFLVVVSISACLVGALVLLPALCLLFRPRFLEP